MRLRGLAVFGFTTLSAFGAADDWAWWRGPSYNGVARGDAPLEWSDTKNVAWKTPIPGRGFSSPDRRSSDGRERPRPKRSALW